MACPFGGEIPVEEREEEEVEANPIAWQEKLGAVVTAGVTVGLHALVSADAAQAARVASRTAIGTGDLVPLKVMDGIRGVPLMPEMAQALAEGARVMTPAGVPHLVLEAIGEVLPWQEVLAHVTDYGNTGWVARTMAVSTSAELGHGLAGPGWQERAGQYGLYGAIAATSLLMHFKSGPKTRYNVLDEAEKVVAAQWVPPRGRAAYGGYVPTNAYTRWLR